MKIALLQLNFTIGAFEYNFNKILNAYEAAVDQEARLVVSSELALFGYPPADILLQTSALERQRHFVDALCRQIGSVPLIVGVATETHDPKGLPLNNSAVFIQDGCIQFTQAKALLPNYDVFDERRYFEPNGAAPAIIEYAGARIGLCVCEDLWGGSEEQGDLVRYHRFPVDDLVSLRPNLLVSIHASPFYVGKQRVRLDVVAKAARKLDCPVVYVNQVGGHDELVFDGHSFVVDRYGKATAMAQGFTEERLLVDMAHPAQDVEYKPDDLGDLYKSLVLGTRDYLQKTNQSHAFVALSGGIDSAVTAAIAVEAIGANNVLGVSMPSRFSSEESIEDARVLAANLKVAFKIVPIDEAYQAYANMLEPEIGWNVPGTIQNDVTEENIQARIRGNIMMAFANRGGGIVLSTGNKSEVSVGYCTLYGDMVGGFAVLSDVLKTKVYALAAYINRFQEIIPPRTISKPPSAELRPNQKDQDSLPAYEILDPIIEAYVEKGLSAEQIVQLNFEPETVRWVLDRIHRNEFKRRQMAPGIKTTPKAFGTGHRMPIACKIQ